VADWLDVALEEYKALRAEVLTTFQTQHTTLTWGTAALGVLIGLGFNAWDEAFVAEFTFLGAVPAIAYLILIIWMGELTRMMRVGEYLKELEARINASLRPDGDALGWETFLRKERETPGKTGHRRWNYRAIILVYQLLAVAAIAIGFHRLGISASVTTVLVIAAEAVAFALVTAFLYWQWCARVVARGRVFAAFSWCCSRLGVPSPTGRTPRRAEGA
jgi:hypothetical protein